MRFRPSSALVLLLALTLSCGSDGGGPSDPVEPGKVTLETGRAASKTIGLSGGTISTTASDGTKYTLVVPEGALAKPRTITITPVADIEGFPVLDNVTAGLDFKPAGLVFATPARLTIEGAGTPGAAEFPIAVNYAGDADAFTLGFAVESGGKIVVPVQHFSGFGLDFGTEEDIAALLSELPTTPDALLCANELIFVFPDDTAAQEDIMRRWFEDTILPDISAAANDGELLVALNNFNFWRTEVPQAIELFLNVETALATEIDQAREAFIPKLQAAVTGNNDLCKQTQSLDALRNVIFWQRQAGALSVDTPANGLDEATVRGILCAELVIEGASLPANMQAGFPHSLDFRLLLKFNDGTTQDVACAVSILAVNATLDNPTGNTDPFGNYTTVITATTNDAVQVFITGHVIMPGETIPSLISDTFIVATAAGVNLAGSYLSPQGSFGILIMEVQQNQNAVTGTFEQRLASFQHKGTFVGTLVGDQLVGVSIELEGCDIPNNQLVTGGFTVVDNRTTFAIFATPLVDCHGHSLGTLQACGPNSVLTELDFGGTYTGSLGLGGTTVGITATVTGGFGGVSGTFTGGRTGSFTADLILPPPGNGCIIGQLTNIQVTFTDCALTGSTTFDSGCAVLRQGGLGLDLSNNNGQLDCEGKEFTGFALLKPMDVCTGD